MKILIIDDDPVFLYTLMRYFKARDYQVLTAENGCAALDVVKRDQPQLIITDIMMPKMTGIELVNYLHKELRDKIPVILISGLDQKAVIREAFKLGPIDFFIKPFNYEDLLRTVQRIEGNMHYRYDVDANAEEVA